MGIIQKVLSIIGELAPELAMALMDGKINEVESRNLISKLVDKVTDGTGKDITFEEATKLFDAAMIIARLAK